MPDNNNLQSINQSELDNAFIGSGAKVVLDAAASLASSQPLATELTHNAQEEETTEEVVTEKQSRRVSAILGAAAMLAGPLMYEHTPKIYNPYPSTPKKFRGGRNIVPGSEKQQGRNTPCACGSGKKYKKCCYLK